VTLLPSCINASLVNVLNTSIHRSLTFSEMMAGNVLEMNDPDVNWTNGKHWQIE
jgi:hypothetical protein